MQWGQKFNIIQQVDVYKRQSYTGERVAMTIAKTLSVISPVKIKVISSLAAYAGKQKCVSVIDARSQKIFVCAYECGKPLIHEQLLPISDFMEFMKDYDGDVYKRQASYLQIIRRIFR